MPASPVGSRQVLHAARDAGGVREQVMDRYFFPVGKGGDEFPYWIVGTQQFSLSQSKDGRGGELFGN